MVNFCRYCGENLPDRSPDPFYCSLAHRIAQRLFHLEIYRQYHARYGTPYERGE